MAEIGLVHLVRAQNGLGPFESFVASYRAHAAGLPHDLIVVFKGFGAEAEKAAYREVLGGLPYGELAVADEGFDIGAYLAAARQLDHRYICFLNSFSTVLAQDWLAKMFAHVTAARVGVVGATGSHESNYTNQARAARLSLWLRRAAYDLRRWRRPERLAVYVGRLLRARQLKRHFPPFPNYHVRTNAFLLPKSVLLKVRVGELANKFDVMAFESGRAGLTRQLSALGLRALVVGRDGLAYEKEEWRQSCTFRAGGQRNLLVADNRTQEYSAADPAVKELLYANTWGTPPTDYDY